MKIIKIVRNELTRLFYQKKFLIMMAVIFLMCLMSVYCYNSMRMDVINHTAKAAKYSASMSDTLLNMNYLKFAVLVSGDFLYKPLFPMYLIFLSITVVSVLSEDYLQGTMKFSLLCGVSRRKLIIGKILSVVILTAMVAIFNFITAGVLGRMFFGSDKVTLSEILNAAAIYMASVIPASAFGIVILFLSLIIKNKTAVLGLSIACAVSVNILDCFTKLKDFSPIGLLAQFSDSTKVCFAGSAHFIVVSLLYIVVFSLLAISKMRRTDITC